MEQEDIVNATKEVIKQGVGKTFVWELLSMCNIYGLNALGSTYEEGRRSIGLDLLSMLEEADPTFYGRLLIEKQESKDG